MKNNENHHHLLQRRWRHLLRYISLFNITPIRLRHGSSGRGGGGGMQQGGAKGGMSQTTNPFSSSSAIDELNVAVKPAEIAALTGVALLISLIAILISSIGILRMNPKKILIS